MGLLIMEPNRRRSRVRGISRCPRTKRWDGTDFRLGATMQLTERRREGERETSRKIPTQSIYQNINN